MSTFYKENNRESAFELFNKKLVYLSDSSSDTYRNLIDFTAEKILYGRVNRIFVPIVIPQNTTRLKNFSSESVTSSGLKALDFVVDAFNDLQRQFIKCSKIGNIDNSDPYLTNLKVYKAYIDPYVRYERYIRQLKSIIKTDPIIDSINLQDFKTLSDSLFNVMENASKTNPLTFPAYIKSKKTPINISGLAIEIADLNASNDDEKINAFINSKNWDFYLNTCRSYGFMVDQNVPWRLIADIGSQPMLEYARNYNSTSTDQILVKYYQSAHYSYYNNFSQQLLTMYNDIKPRAIIKLSECNNKTKIKRVRPQEYKTTEILKESYGQDDFLMLYCKLRFSEEESRYTDQEKNTIMRDTLQLSKIKSTNTAIEQFERFLNQTLDYQGSLSYYINKNRTEEQEEIDQTTRY
tara:strand:- start:13715 stop:14935 length:1221 start_codon:yes stop_codon:yes gene_type:complete